MSDKVFPDLACAWAKCPERASHVAVQTHDLQLIFQGQAAVVCNSHADTAREEGCAVLSFQAFGDALRREEGRGHGRRRHPVG